MKIAGIFCSPRPKGNSDLLLRELLDSAQSAGAEITEIHARKLKIAPCIGCDKCIELGHCFQRDDFDSVKEQLLAADVVALSTPVHFYTVSTQAMILIGRIQAVWNQKYVNKKDEIVNMPQRPGVLVAVGATKGAKLFDGLRMTVKYFFDAMNVDLTHEILVRGVDHKGDILNEKDILQQARELGSKLAGG